MDKTDKALTAFAWTWVVGALVLNLGGIAGNVFILEPTVWDGIHWLLVTYSPLNFITYLTITVELSPALLAEAWREKRRTRYLAERYYDLRPPPPLETPAFPLESAHAKVVPFRVQLAGVCRAASAGTARVRCVLRLHAGKW